MLLTLTVLCSTTGITEPAGQEEEQTLTERAALVNQPKLINPSEVLISQPTVLEHAEPVLTPLGNVFLQAVRCYAIKLTIH